MGRLLNLPLQTYLYYVNQSKTRELEEQKLCSTYRSLKVSIIFRTIPKKENLTNSNFVRFPIVGGSSLKQFSVRTNSCKDVHLKQTRNRFNKMHFTIVDSFCLENRDMNVSLIKQLYNESTVSYPCNISKYVR